MKSAIVALINDPVIRSIGLMTVFICSAAFLTYIVLQLHAFSEYREERVESHAQLMEAQRKSDAEHAALLHRVSELEWTVWGDLEPRIEKHEQQAKPAPVVRVPQWRNREQEILERLRVLEQWRLRHMSVEH